MRQLLILLFLTVSFTYAQNLPFAEEVEAIALKYDTIWDSSKETGKI